MDAPRLHQFTFDEIYEDHFNFVWKNLRRLGTAAENLEDATQDVFIVIHRQLAEQTRYTSIKAWLCGISVRVAKDYRRRRMRKEGHLEPLSFDVVDGGQPTPFDNAAQSEAVRVFESLVGQLAEDHRTIFVLAELEQMTAKAIGEALGMNMNTVNSRLRAARAQFEKLVARHQTLAQEKLEQQTDEGAAR
jgi:RNA polymerase sigma-70 factor (ECF subfamily)